MGTSDDGRRKTILVVEDSAVQALALLNLLEQEGLNVLCAQNGQTGLSLAEEHAPDAIILDIAMPEMDGIEACRRLKANPRTARIPVVVLTGHAEPSLLLEGLDVGALDFIPKDVFSNQVLLETLRALGVL